MQDITHQVIAAITKHKQRLLELHAGQDALNAELEQLETDYEAGRVTQAQLDRRLGFIQK